MAKNFHEIRDPIHTFIRLDSDERKVLDSRPFQRLRYIHQLATTYLVYPGATHKRFEHSLGVMELAGRVFDVLTQPGNITDDIRKVMPELERPDALLYWKRALRMAALCHDIGHLPFSHAAEKELLPPEWNHELLTRDLILCSEMQAIWSELIPPLNAEHIAKIAIGPEKAKGMSFTDWEVLLSEIIIGDSFGADRMDYLLRDSYHAGVAYGRFDHYRLIDTLRILPPPPVGESDEQSIEPSLGVEEGGLHSAEALLLARYFMYSQVYFHPVRRIYDIHLKDFLKEWLPEGRFSVLLDDHLALTDNEVLVAMRKAYPDVGAPGHEPARRILSRQHFKVIYDRNPYDMNRTLDKAPELVHAAAERQFGKEKVRYDHYAPKGGAPSFPVLKRDGRVVDSIAESQTLSKLPVVAVDYVFIAPDLRYKAEQWLLKNRDDILSIGKEVET